MKATKVFEETYRAWVGGKRRCLHEGGTASSKTYSVLQFLYIMAKQAKESVLISVVSESIPHVKRGCLRDWFNIINMLETDKSEGADNNPCYNKTEMVYTRPEWKGIVEFFGADDDGKVRGPRRDILFMNEGNNIPWETARGLDIRTSKFTIVDWNPVSEFWAHEYWIGEEENHYVHSTYKDAKEAGVIPLQTVSDIESYRDKDPNWWSIFGLGLVGKIEGLVYPSFTQVDFLPDGMAFYGLDFGFLTDPTVLVKNIVIGDKLYSREMFYVEGHMTNDQIAREMDLCGLRKGYDRIYADPSEPKSIEEILRMGFNIKEAVKGPGSVEFGHQKVNQYYQHWTKDSLNCIKEQRNFRFLKDRTSGRLTDRTTHKYSHGMDARRYAVATHVQRRAGLIVQPVSYM